MARVDAPPVMRVGEAVAPDPVAVADPPSVRETDPEAEPEADPEAEGEAPAAASSMMAGPARTDASATEGPEVRTTSVRI